MVGFGMSMIEARRPGWEEAYLEYNELKIHLRIVKEMIHQLPQSSPKSMPEEHPLLRGPESSSTLESPNLSTLVQHRRSFLVEIRKQIEKVSLFAVKKEGDLANAAGSLQFGKNLSTSFDPGYVRALAGPIPDGAQVLSILGVELLHLLRYICINATGLRKILKKFRKLSSQALSSMSYHPMMGDEEICDSFVLDLDYSNDTPATLAPQMFAMEGILSSCDQLQGLANSNAVRIIHDSLRSAVRFALENTEKPVSNEERLRLRFIMDSIQTVRISAETVNGRFRNFLSRKAMISTGDNLGDIDGSALDALTMLLRFDPDSTLYISQKELHDWSEWVNQESGEPYGGPIWNLSAPSFGDREQLHFQIMRALSNEKKAAATRKEMTWGGVDSASLLINLISTLLYTVNYYIVAPNANRYSIVLGHDGAFGATLIGASSLAAIFAAFLYSVWYATADFRSALIFSSMCPLVGNILYSLAASYQSMTLAICGRILCGFGSAEVVNRQLISACVSFERISRASAFFVAAGAAGMSIGPLLGSIFDMCAGRDQDVDLRLSFLPAGGIIYNHITAPGFCMAVLWLMQLLCVAIFFKEPERLNGTRVDQNSRKGLWNEINFTFKSVFSKAGLPITLLLFCYIEMADEILISSCSMVCRRYFSWHGSAAGLLIASLGSLVLPADFVVEKASRRLSERRIMKVSLLFIVFSAFAILNFEALIYDVVGCIASLTKSLRNGKDESLSDSNIGDMLNSEGEFPYDWGLGSIVYVVSLSSVFMGTIILEGVDTSLMAKVTPAELNNSVINSGLLATLIGTLGRVFADVLITLSALLDAYVFVDFVNVTFLPLMVLAFVGYMLVVRNYNDFLVG